MNRGLLLKSFRELWSTTVILGVALLIVEALFTYILPTFFGEMSAEFLRIPFIRNMMQAWLGSEIGEMLDPSMMNSITWIHPVVLSIVWGHAVIIGTRFPAGEIDRGTIDVLYGLPVSRWSVYWNDLAACFIAVLFLLFLGLIGNSIGGRIIDEPLRPDLGRVLIILANLLCMYLAVLGLTSLVSATSSRRGRAIAVVFGILVFSFLLNFLSQLWEPALRLKWLTLLTYYQPLFILRDGRWPLGDMIVLMTTGVVLWTAGGIIFSRRSICTV